MKKRDLTENLILVFRVGSQRFSNDFPLFEIFVVLYYVAFATPHSPVGWAIFKSAVGAENTGIDNRVSFNIVTSIKIKSWEKNITH